MVKRLLSYLPSANAEILVESREIPHSSRNDIFSRTFERLLKPASLPATKSWKIMAYRILNSAAEVAAYAESLDERWPQRDAIAQHLSDQLAGLEYTAPHVVELCVGPGKLASVLLAAHPHITYTGIDISAPSLAYAQHRLTDHAARTTWMTADLNEEQWFAQVQQPVHAIVSMQSLHDLGDEAAVARIYQLAYELLTAPGLLAVADLLAASAPENPGRLSVARHQDLLRLAGFKQPECTWTPGDFGCFVAHKVVPSPTPY
jgi:hypothetical protein